MSKTSFWQKITNPDPILSYPILSYPILSYPILSYPILSYPILSYPILSYPILSYPILSYPVLSCPVLSCPVLSCPVLSYPIQLIRLYMFTETSTLTSEIEPEPVANPVRLPWGVVRERVAFPESVHISTNSKPGEFVLQTLFAEFTVLAEKKINLVLEPPVCSVVNYFSVLVVLIYIW